MTLRAAANPLLDMSAYLDMATSIHVDAARTAEPPGVVMKPIRRILFAVRNPDAARQPAIIKAIRIAKSFGASIDLFHALASPGFTVLQPMTGESIEALRARMLERVRARLEKFATLARRHRVMADCSVEWDYPPHEAIVRRAGTNGADLIVAECHRSRHSRGWLMRLTDWELLRASELPVLLLKNSRVYRRPVVLAAVDPSHAHAKPARLDADILKAATRFSVTLHGRLHVVHAIDPSLGTLAMSAPTIDATAAAMSYEVLEAEARAAFERFMGAMDVDPARRHLVNTSPARAIPAVARATRAGLVVMGAVSRSAMQRLFIGSTAERVLDALPCDVLVLKPRGTRTRVAAIARRSQAAAGFPARA
jgi:universal stress protein E